MITFSDDDITNYGCDRTIEMKRSWNGSEDAKGMLTVPGVPLVEADVYVNL